MGKASRPSHRKASAEAQLRMARQKRRQPYVIGGSAALVAAAVALIVVLFASSSGNLPNGTKSFAEADHRHVAGAVKYDHTPPAGGAHNVTWLNCGIYTQAVPNENAVHSLEHGAVWITYRPNLSPSEVNQLRIFVATHYDGSQLYLVLSPFPGLPAPVVASAWGAQIQLKGANDPRLVAFVTHFIGGAQGGEPGAPCTGGIGSPI